MNCPPELPLWFVEKNNYYAENPGAFIYAVGTIKEKVKDGKTYRDLRPWGWVLVVIEDEKPKRGTGKGKK